MKRRDALLLALPVLGRPGVARATPSPADEALATRLHQGGVAVLLRHAITDPGVGDPPGFRLDDCSTQRNLSATGRAQAQRIGAWFSTRGLRPARVRASAWCRCIETGRLAFGAAEAWPALNSHFGDPAARARQATAIEQEIGRIGPHRFEVWVTHQVNISALTGEMAAMGEGWVVGRAPAGAATKIQALGGLRFDA